MTITKNSHERLVLPSVEEYARLIRRDHEVIRPAELTDDKRAAIAAASVPAELAALDDELKGWKP